MSGKEGAGKGARPATGSRPGGTQSAGSMYGVSVGSTGVNKAPVRSTKSAGGASTVTKARSPDKGARSEPGVVGSVAISKLEEVAEPLNGGGTGEESSVSLSRILSKPVREPSFFLGLGTTAASPASVDSGASSPLSESYPSSPHMGNANGVGQYGVGPHWSQGTNKVGSSTTPMPDDYVYLKNVVPQLKRDLKDRESRINDLEAECSELKRLLKKREMEKTGLEREVHKLRSVLEITHSPTESIAGLVSSNGPAPTVPVKRQGVSGESSNQPLAAGGSSAAKILIPKVDKDFRSKQVIKGAILENDFLKHLDGAQLKAMVDAMISKDVPQGCYIIREGDAGSHLYVAAEGELEVMKGGKVLGRLGAGKVFGELAILYNCQRTASIRAVTAAKLWSLERRVFQEVMMHTGLQRREDNLQFLRSVALLQTLRDDMLMRIADVLEVEYFPQGTYVVRQGGKGDTFYIISSGEVKVTQNVPSPDDPTSHVEEEIRLLGRGDYFGEQALLREDVRTANVVATDGGVECLVVDRESFTQLIGDLRELREKKYEDSDRSSRTTSVFSLAGEEPLAEHNHISIDDLNVLGTLGVGGFGRVELVQYSRDKSITFALKCLKKQHIVETQQQIHVLSEKKIMLHCRHPFIARLFRTYKDTKFVYLLLEALLGGELWTVLREHGRFDEIAARFYAGCVLEAFEYLHGKGIIYRDLKPENLLMDSHGFVKLVDFGFSKRLGAGEKTWTFCGTPEYVAPEVILNKGHDKAVDYWSLGVFLFELLTGAPPFSGSDPMRTYSVILRGIDCIPFPRHISRNAQGVIRRLCRDNPSERLGYGRNGIADIKKHKWFQGFDWDGLRNRQLLPPIIPAVKGPSDISNFDSYPKDLDIPPDELSGWDRDF